MAATQTLAQASPCGKFSGDIPAQPQIVASQLRPRRGVVVLYGYGIRVRVGRGHLIVEDGIGSDRYQGRFPRVNHGLERLIVIGGDGEVSLAALRWLSDQNASFVMLERDGKVLATTGPVRPSEIRLRRAQALAHQSKSAFRISRELIDRKLAGQERVARELVRDDSTSAAILRFRSELAEVESIDAIRAVEARAAKAYWKAWRSLPILFPQKELYRVPDHWQQFGSRVSPLSSSPRLAANPINAILNYLYALLEAESRLALAALGLDPGMGVLHMDTTNRDSLACDLMEAVRPDVDSYVLSRIVDQPLTRNWFFEERNGNCRLSAELAKRLAETAPSWARLIAPVAEWMAQEFASTTTIGRLTPTRLTQTRKRELFGEPAFSQPKAAVPLEPVCKGCGKPRGVDHSVCKACADEVAAVRLSTIARKGRVASHAQEAQKKRSKTQQVSYAARQSWSGIGQPSWLTEQFFTEKVQPCLGVLSNGLIVRELSVSRGYANEVKRGRVPHPRHWRGLAALVGVSG